MNMIKPSRRKSQISVHAMVEGSFDFNRMLLAPPGTKVIVHEKHNKIRTWNQHGIQGWYIVLSVENY